MKINSIVYLENEHILDYFQYNYIRQFKGKNYYDILGFEELKKIKKLRLQI